MLETVRGAVRRKSRIAPLNAIIIISSNSGTYVVGGGRVGGFYVVFLFITAFTYLVWHLLVFLFSFSFCCGLDVAVL